jgi:nuclease S1
MKRSAKRLNPHMFPRLSRIPSLFSSLFSVHPSHFFLSITVVLLTLCIHLLSIISVHAWGTLAHRVIVQVAQRHIAPETQQEITALLGSRPLVDMAMTADEWRSSRPETAPWHYVNIPFAAVTYDAARDCPTADCVIAAIAKYQAILSNRRRGQVARREALIFLIHFVADIHQPLHCIDNRDRGGNESSSGSLEFLPIYTPYGIVR